MDDEQKLKYTKLFLGLLVIVALLIWVAVFQKPDKFLHVYFLDVGQGDSIYVRTMNNVDMLIDGGPCNNVLSELGDIMPFYDRKIEYILLTHPHADHVSGLIEVIKRYEVGRIISTDAVHTSNEYLEWLTTIKEKNIPFQLIRNGDVINLDEDVEFRIFWPENSYRDKNIDNLNNTSIVGKLTYNNIDFMLTGDAEDEVQNAILKNYSADELQSEIYKVAHQGSKDSANEDFIKAINPELSIIFAGVDNKFGHPHQIALDLLSSINSEILRTDQNSRIEVISDGQKFWTKSEK